MYLMVIKQNIHRFCYYQLLILDAHAVFQRLTLLLLPHGSVFVFGGWCDLKPCRAFTVLVGIYFRLGFMLLNQVEFMTPAT